MTVSKLAWRIIGAIAGIIILLGVFWYGLGKGWFGWHEGPGEIAKIAVPAEVVQNRAVEHSTPGVTSAKQILFGDFHVHTTFSADAFSMSLPQAQGEGAHPPADACDFARFCSSIDFYANTDHSEQITERHWQETIDTVRQCNAVTDPANPDLVAFLGWEWTQVGFTPESHYGHKNVILKGIEDNEITQRPISPGGLLTDPDKLFASEDAIRQTFLFSGFDPEYLRMSKFVAEHRAIENCPDNVNTRDLPSHCRENAETPEVLFRKLNEAGVESIVIPHGTAWGYYTPPGSDWAKQLNSKQHDPNRQTLFEVFSAHGNSEQYRSWRDVSYDEQGNRVCPAATADYQPGCRRAGEIIAERCVKANLGVGECEKRAAEARQNYVDTLGIGGYLTVPATKSADWQDSGQCRDCFQPPFHHRPLSTAQYVMALRNFGDLVDGKPMRFDFGFIASSDNHGAHSGVGYKEFGRLGMTEVAGKPTGFIAKLRLPKAEDPVAQSRPVQFGQPGFPVYAFTEQERNTSFYQTGGLVAIHAQGRTRDAIWNAVKAKETYATSGPRILLWFDLLDDDVSSPAHPMGSHVVKATTPRFRVTAVGSYKQKPGCPDYSKNSLTAERLARLCRNECYNPSDERLKITRIEVVRIHLQNAAGESVDGLIEDHWKTFQCQPDEAGCTVTFDDPDFVKNNRDTVYYVRAIQEPTPAVNADNLGCKKRGADGRCLEVDLCGFDKDPKDDCLSPSEERAWSSPILVDKMI